MVFVFRLFRSSVVVRAFRSASLVAHHSAEGNIAMLHRVASTASRLARARLPATAPRLAARLAAAAVGATAAVTCCDDWDRKHAVAASLCETAPTIDAQLPAPSRRVTDDYTLGEELGSGNFARVVRGRCKKTGKEVAIKVCLLYTSPSPRDS